MPLAATTRQSTRRGRSAGYTRPPGEYLISLLSLPAQSGPDRCSRAAESLASHFPSRFPTPRSTPEGGKKGKKSGEWTHEKRGGPPGPCGGCPGPSLDDCQQLPRLDGLTRLDAQLLHGTRPGRRDLVLHLHRLDHQQALAGFDRCPDL